MSTYRIIAYILILLSVSCRHTEPDMRLKGISLLAEKSPAEALDSLNAIPYSSLSEDDRHFYDFLSVKVPDKAYVPHTSDSLILKVIEYESAHQSNGRYPEALYYGGRVYSDLGDYPTAISYLQESLDKIDGDDTESLRLKGCVTSQLGRRLNSVRLYSEAIPYLNMAIHIDSILCDTFNLAYDHELLGGVYFDQDSLELASRYFRIAGTWAQYLSEEDVSYIQMYQAAIALRLDDVSSAISLIRDIPGKVWPMQRNIALAYSSDIYMAAGRYDSAYIFADSIIHGPGKDNLKSGYRNMFSPELRPLIPRDSLSTYVTGFYNVVENNYNKLESQQISDQVSRYNYSLHQRERLKAESAKNRFVLISLISGMAALILFSVVLVIQNRRKGMLLELNSALLELESIRQSHTDTMQCSDTGAVSLVDYGSASELKERLKARLKTLTEQPDLPPVPRIILDSDAYAQLKRYAAEGKAIPESNSLWDSLESVVLSASPSFRNNIRLLVGTDMKRQDYNAVLLIKCGIPTGEMAALLGRTKGTISYRRKHVCEIILGERISPALIDTLIRFI